MGTLISGVFCFGLSLFVLIESILMGLGTLQKPGPGFIPFCASVVMACSSVTLVYRVWGFRESRKDFSGRVILALVSLFVYSLVLETLGFIVATFLLVGLFFRLGEPRPWWMLLGMSLLVTFLAYFVFGVLFQIYFPRGFLGI